LNKPIIYGIILSAGLSGRMKKFKPLLDFKGKSFIKNVVLKINSVCDKIIIVTGFKAKEVEENVNQLNIHSKIEFVYNPEYKKGMFTSLQAGLLKANSCDWVLYHFVDQPGLPEKFYTNFIQQIDDLYNWIQPVIGKRRGHPILINKSMFDLIRNAPAESSLRKIAKKSVVKKKYWQCEFKEIFQDVDTEEDLSHLK
jgi:molybdenum cofactor cytidylyltransferase